MATTPLIYEDGAIDFSRPPKEVLFERFNAINSTPFNPDDFVLSQVEVVIGPNYNTRVVANPTTTSQWSKGFPMYYTRVPIQEQMAHPAEVPTANQTNLYGILDTINVAYGIYLTEADVLDAVIDYNTPGDRMSNGTVQLVARATSIFFTGQITIPVNNNVSHGISTYDDELTHYLAVRSATVVGPDKLIAVDALGQLMNNFTFLPGHTWEACNIRHLFKRPDGRLIVLGTFTYTTPVSSPGGAIRRTDRVLWLNGRGEPENASAGALYGLAYSGLQYVEAFNHNRVYALDLASSVGGTLHGMLAFRDTGDVDTTFSTNLTSKVDAMCVYGDWIYVGIRTGNTAMLRRLLKSGLIDTTFPAKTITLPSGRPEDGGRIAAMYASERGVALVVAPGDPTQGWEEQSGMLQPAGVSAPIIMVGHDGVVEEIFSKKDKLLTTNRAGVAWPISYSAPLVVPPTVASRVVITSKAVLYLANAVDLKYGTRSVCPISITEDGELRGAFNGVNISDYPKFAQYLSMELSTRGDVILAAESVEPQVTGNGFAVHATIVAFDFQGNYAARLYTLRDHSLLAYKHHRFM